MIIDAGGLESGEGNGLEHSPAASPPVSGAFQVSEPCVDICRDCRGIRAKLEAGERIGPTDDDARIEEADRVEGILDGRVALHHRLSVQRPQQRRAEAARTVFPDTVPPSAITSADTRR